MKSQSMYRAHILDLYKNPQNFGELENATHEFTEVSPACGDEITIKLIIKKGKVEEDRFNGSGCVISMVASSLLTEELKGMNKEEILKLNKNNILELLGIKLTPSRLSCALIPLNAAKNAFR